jgi:hypothetical protein
MTPRFISILLVGAGLVVLSLAVVAHFGPVEIPDGTGDPFILSVDVVGSPYPPIIVGSLLLIVGIAIEVHSKKKDKQRNDIRDE